MPGMLQGKRALVVGIMNKHSIATSITRSLLQHGAKVMIASKVPLSSSQIASCQFNQLISEQNKIDQKTIIYQSIDQLHVHTKSCDVAKEEDIQSLVDECSHVFSKELDILIHSIAFAPNHTFQSMGLLNVSKQDWNVTMDISAYSLIALTRAIQPLMSHATEVSKECSIIALSYLGAYKIVPNYNVMGPAKAALEANVRQLAYECGPLGIRVNCVSPGPMNTVSARGIPGISQMREYAATHSPLKKSASAKDVGETTCFLASDLASSITGQTIYVDAGLNSMAPH